MNKYCVYWIDGGKVILKAVCEEEARSKACRLSCRPDADVDRIIPIIGR